MRDPLMQPGRWYREPWPWLLMAAPAASIVLGVAMWTLAVRSDDGIVAQDYYKQGLAINQKLRHSGPPASSLWAVVQVDRDGNVRASVEGIATTAPPTIRLKLGQPSRTELVAVLARDAVGEYVGRIDATPGGRLTVALESETWRMPATTVVAPLSEIRFGPGVERR